MPLTMVNSVTIRMDRFRQFEECVGELASRAADKKESWHWTGHQALFGDTRTLHFAYSSPDFAGLEQIGTVDELWRRCFGEKRGEEHFAKANACIEESRHTISIDRPDLSYPPEGSDRTAYPIALVTTARARPGKTEALEELIRKLAEAIPKVDDPARMLTFQAVVGDIREFWTVRPLESLGDLDRHLPAPELLSGAFGAAEGGLLWRSGNDAVEQVERQILAYREEPSNPG